MATYTCGLNWLPDNKHWQESVLCGIEKHHYVFDPVIVHQNCPSFLMKDIWTKIHLERFLCVYLHILGKLSEAAVSLACVREILGY